MTVVIVCGALAAAALIAGVTAFLAYDRATKLDRSTPTVVLRQYLYAQFDDRQPAQAEIFLCDNPQVDQLNAMLDDIKSREQRFNVPIVVDMANSQTQTREGDATVSADLVMTARMGAANPVEYQPWRFEFVDDGGWRLCTATRSP